MSTKDEGGGWNKSKSKPVTDAAPSHKTTLGILRSPMAASIQIQLLQQGGPFAQKNLYRGSTGSSRHGLESDVSEAGSCQLRVRAMLHLPEYSDLNELYKEANKILHHSGYQAGDKLNADDEEFILHQILAYHPDKKAKLGCGVKNVLIDVHHKHEVRCFWVVRKDGSRTDFSYWKCLQTLLDRKRADRAGKETARKGCGERGGGGSSSNRGDLVPQSSTAADEADDDKGKLPSIEAIAMRMSSFQLEGEKPATD